MEDNNSEEDSSEIDDLKYRISQLEHLYISSLPCNGSVTSSPDNKGIDSVRCSSSGPINSTSCCSCTQQQALLNRSQQLESLLAASELDSQKLEEKIVLLNVDRNRNHVTYLENLRIRDKEIEDLKYNMKLLQGTSEKYKQRFENVKNYINTLPSEEELSEAKRVINKLETDNQFLNDKVQRLEAKLASVQQEIFKKESQYQDALVRLEELRPLEKAQENVLKGADKRLERLNFSNKKEVIEFITIQKAQLERSKNIITSFKEKMTKLTEDKSQCMAKIMSQSMLLKESQEHLVGFQIEIDKLTEKLQVLQEEKAQLTSQCEDYKSVVCANANFRKIRDEQLGNIVKLVMEIDLCVFEMQKSMELTQKMCSGEEPPVDSFIGLSDFDFHVDILCGPSNQEEEKSEQNEKGLQHVDHPSTDYDKSDADVDTEWVLERWEKVRDLRKSLSKLRSQLNDLYADKLTGTIEGCPVQ